MNYLALKTDIINSRKIPFRWHVQDKFLETAQQLNSRFADQFTAAFVVTHGDEAQGLLNLSALNSLYEIIEFLKETMWPVQLRFGIGYGTLNTKLQKLSIGMDGEAWQKAKLALEEARTSHQYVCYQGFNPQLEDAIESLTNILLYFHSHWTKEQREVIALVNSNLTQSSIAKKLKISEVAVSKRLSAANWKQYSRAKDALKLLLIHPTLTSYV